jgi:hypothetical protein
VALLEWLDPALEEREHYGKTLMTRVPQPMSLESKSPRFGIKDPKNPGMQKRFDGEDRQIGSVNSKTSFFRKHFLKKWLN